MEDHSKSDDHSGHPLGLLWCALHGVRYDGGPDRWRQLGLRYFGARFHGVDESWRAWGFDGNRVRRAEFSQRGQVRLQQNLAQLRTFLRIRLPASVVRRRPDDHSWRLSDHLSGWRPLRDSFRRSQLSAWQ